MDGNAGEESLNPEDEKSVEEPQGGPQAIPDADFEDEFWRQYVRNPVKIVTNGAFGAIYKAEYLH
jgi:hypothetical protein